MAEKKRSEKEKEPDITFYHPDLLEVPENGLPTFSGSTAYYIYLEIGT